MELIILAAVAILIILWIVPSRPKRDYSVGSTPTFEHTRTEVQVSTAPEVLPTVEEAPVEKTAAEAKPVKTPRKPAKKKSAPSTDTVKPKRKYVRKVKSEANTATSSTTSAGVLKL